MFITHEMLAINKVGGIKDGDKLIEKYRKLLKIRKLSKSLKLSKSGNWKNEKLFKSQKLAKLEKNCQKMRIHLILTLKKIDKAF